MVKNREVVLAVRYADERQAFADLLADMQMIVHHAQTGQDAIYLLEDHVVGFLVMDVKLADMHAWKMLGTLRESVDLSQLQIIVVMDEANVVPLPNVTVIVRPVSMAKLRQIIGSLIDT